MRVALRPTVAEDLAALTHEPLPIRIRAITALAANRVLGIGGIGYRPDDVVIGFAVIAPEFRRYPVALHRAGLAMMRVIRDSGVPRVIAEAQADNPAAVPWLLRLGFRDVGRERLFLWEAPHA